MAGSSTYTLSQLRSLVRQELKDGSASSFADADLDVVIRRALEAMSRDTDYLRMAKGVAHVAGNPDVSLSERVCRIRAAWWRQTQLEICHVKELSSAQWVLFGSARGGHPLRLFHFEDRSELKLWPVPQDGPPETTLSAAISDTGVQDIEVASTSVMGSPAGRAEILPEGGNALEQVEYHGLGTGKLLSCSRGVALTTAGPHGVGAVVRYLPLTVFYSYIHPVLSGGNAWSFPDDFSELLILKATQLAHRIRRRYSEAELYRREYHAALGPFRQRDAGMANEGAFFFGEQSGLGYLSPGI